MCGGEGVCLYYSLSLQFDNAFVFYFSPDKPKVAFSASLFGHGGQTVGGHSSEEILKFQKVFTNIGDAYSPTTGTKPSFDRSISENKFSCV